MSDIVSRLLLDTKQYDASLGKAKKSSNDFSGEVMGKLSGAVAKFAAGIGVAVGGVEAFNKLMGSSQTLGDSWNNTLNACKGTVDAFFFSLASNNWDVFNNGLIRTIENMYQLSALRDQLSDARLSMGFETRQFEREYVRLEGIIDDESKSKEERVLAEQAMRKLVSDYKDRVGKTVAGNAEALVKEMNSKFGRNDFTIDDFVTFVREVNNETLDSQTLKELNEYKRKQAEIIKRGTISTQAGMWGSVSSLSKEAKQELENLKSENSFLEKMRLFQEDGDESRKRMVEDYEYMLELTQRADEFLKRSIEKKNKVHNLNKGGAVVQTTPVADGYKPYTTTGKDLSGYKQATMPTTLQPIPITKQTVATTEDYVNSLSALSNVLTSLNTQTVEGAAGWLSWAGSLMTASAMAVDSIRKVVAAKTAEGAASAGAEAAKTPFVGWMLVGGAVLSALAAFAAIPSFAEGGVVPGANFRDGIAARLSSGEMVINPADQKRLYDSIHSGNLGGGGSSRSVITGEQIVTVVNNYGRRTGRGTILKG